MGLQQVWNSVPVLPAIDISRSLDLELKIIWSDLCSRKALPPTGIALDSLAPWILWHLWTARNNLIFNNRHLTSAEVVSKAIASAREWVTSQGVASRNLTPPIRPPPIATQGVCLIRTDAAWNETTKIAGLGWTIEESREVASYSRASRHVSSPLAAEGLALREAILKCRDRGISKIRCESDSAILVKAINNGKSLAGLYGILSDISSLAFSFDSITFNWISRERNTVADCLAKQVLDVELAIMASPNFG